MGEQVEDIINIITGTDPTAGLTGGSGRNFGGGKGGRPGPRHTQAPSM